MNEKEKKEQLLQRMYGNVYTDQCCEFDGYGTLSALRILCDSRADVRTETGEFCLPLCSKIPIAQRMGRDNEYKGEKYLL